jgi:anti-repressor protein
MGKSQWSRWYKKNIEDNPYAIEMKDWMGFDIMSNGNTTRDFQLTIDFAKKLSMLSRTEVGERIRDYFVECEKRLTKSVISIPDFSDPAAAARAWADQYEKRTLAEAKIQEDAPKVIAAEVLLDSGENLTVAQFAKVIDVGSVTLFQWLRDQKYLINKGVQHNLPYEVYKKQGLFIVKENPLELKNSTKIHLQTFITPKGQLRLTNHWVSSHA